MSNLTDRILICLFSGLLAFSGMAVHSDAEVAGRMSLLDEGLSWQRCGPEAAKDNALELTGPGSDSLLLDASALEYDRNAEVAVLTGDVTARRDQTLLQSDWSRYAKPEDRLQARGDLFYREPGLRLVADEGDFVLGENKGSITNIRGYRLPDGGARGDAAKGVLHDRDRSSFERITYTTCRPGNNDWLLQADKVDIDKAEGTGVARNAVVRFKDVPILYAPYLSFPIDKRRKSGLLTPEINSLSGTGLDITAPYYLNLAPNYDATIYPRYMSDRGLMLGGEFRLLTPTSQGQVKGEIIEDQDAPEGEDDLRGSFSLRHLSRPTPRWYTRLHADYVSDSDYITDFGSNLGVTSVVHLERTAEAIYYGNFWNLTSRVQNYQTVDRTYRAEDRPYSRLPQFLLNAEVPARDSNLTLHLTSELVAFDRDDTVDGQRFDLMPGISYPMRRSWGHLIPKLSARYTAYDLADQAAGLPDQPDRALPVFSLDSGLVFERPSSWFGQAALQTLEPRLFYLYTPYEDQTELPIFDTAAYGFNFDNLFRENRYVGADRQGDANQMTAALTSNIFSELTGANWLSASLGQIYYFRDQEVQLPGVIPRSDQHSSLVSEVSSQLTTDLKGRVYLQWNPTDESTEKLATEMRYKDDERRILNLAYRYEDNVQQDYSQQQVDAAFYLPIDAHWNLVGRWNYSFEDEKTLDRFAGVEYDTCCWAFRVVGRDFVNGDQTTTGLFVQLELKGLGNLGQKADRVIEDGVMGYRVRY